MSRSPQHPPQHIDNDIPPVPVHPEKIYHPFALPVLALLIPGSVFGVLARLGLTALMDYDGAVIFPLAYAQAIGCLVMGLCLALKDPIGHFYAPLYTMLTTGFCGSLTTFSTWQFDIFDSWINAGQYHRNGFQDVLNGVGISAITLSLSLASLSFGYSAGSLLLPFIARPRLCPPKIRYSLTVLSCLSYAATLLTYFLLPSSYRHQATAALVFSFPGALTRYILSITLNHRFKALPAGTLIANTFGTALLAAFHTIQNSHTPVSSDACSVIQGLIDGYCGCLTTVSTFAAEISESIVKKAWRYGFLSWVLGQTMMVLILGSSIWTGSVEKQMTCSY